MDVAMQVKELKGLEFSLRWFRYDQLGLKNLKALRKEVKARIKKLENGGA